MEQYDVFISYSRIDTKQAEEIQQALEAVGLRCFRDTRIHTGEDFIETLSERIIDSKIFLLLGSSNAYSSKWTKKEILFADKHNRQIVPYMLDGSQLPPKLDFLLGNLNQRFMRTYPIKQLVEELQTIIEPFAPKPTPQPVFPKHKPQQINSHLPFQRGCPVEFIANNVKFNMMPVKAGRFMMGTSCRGNGYPAHEVLLLKDFYIGETEVTQSLWQAVMGYNPSYFKGVSHPVEMVSWEDCREFIRRLNILTNHHFRFPTEAEWEFSARGGTMQSENFYAGCSEIWNVAWYNENNQHGTSPVKLKMKNELGLYDMSGNVYEWCQDFYADYPNKKLTDPQGPRDGHQRVARGGCWYEDEARCRVYIRNKALPSTRSTNLGFRLALSYDS